MPAVRRLSIASTTSAEATWNDADGHYQAEHHEQDRVCHRRTANSDRFISRQSV